MPRSELSSLLKLPSQKRMELAERLWLSVADEASLPVSLEHKKTVRSRLADYRAGLSKAVSHEEMMKGLRAR